MLHLVGILFPQTITRFIVFVRNRLPHTPSKFINIIIIIIIISSSSSIQPLG